MAYENRDKEILLGQSMNHAVTIMRGSVKNVEAFVEGGDQLKKTYKSLVRLFYAWNTEIKQEVFNVPQTTSTITEESVGSSDTGGAKAKTKPCPKCGEQINTKFMWHGCGWKG